MAPTIYNRIRLLAALILLAALMMGAPTPTHAAGATICNTAGMNRAPLAQATESHRAGLVIDFGDGRVLTYCIDLGEDGQATGEELLRATNLPVIMEYSGNGGAVCKIDNVGSDFPAESCFSHCTLQPGETCIYWSYSQLVGDHWQFLQAGASSTEIHSGDVYGWAWGVSTVAQGAKPPLRTLAEICPPATVTPTATITPLPSATPTVTLPPTMPPALPPPTATPYVARVITATPTVSATPTRTPTSSPVVVQPTPTTVPVQPAAPTAQPASILPSPTPAPPPPTATPSATALPQPTITPSLADTRGGVPAPETANRGAGASTRIQIPLIQHSIAAVPSATARPTTQAETATITLPTAKLVPTATRPSPLLDATDDDPTRTYPYFGGTAALLLAGWALLRRGRRAS